MSNNIEWSHTDSRPAIVDPDDIPGSYEGLGVGEIGVWLGSDGANILYGSKDSMIEWAKHLLRIVEEAKPVRGPDDGSLIGILNGAMYVTPAEPGEHVDWNEPDVHEQRYWESLFGWMPIADYAATNPHMIVFVVTPEEAEDLGYDWQDDAIGAAR